MNSCRWYYAYAQKHGFLINKEIEDVIFEGLERKKQLLGARFCPCKIANTIENVCPCKEFRTEGCCHCGLFKLKDREVLEVENTKKRVLFLCTHNSARSQMAEGLLRAMYGDRYEVYSAGSEVTRVNPYVFKSMAEIGIDLSAHSSKLVEKFIAMEIDYVATVCDNAKEACPFFPNAKQYYHQSFPDPSKFIGTEEEILKQVAQVREQIKAWIVETFG